MDRVTDWKPGDVALVRNEYGVWNRAILQVRPDGHRWVYGVAWSDIAEDHEVHPLVVIDPEDADSLERLRSDLIDSGWIPQGDADALDNILRHFANPTPRIEEPTAIGATVTDSDGEMWVRDVRGNWICLHSIPGNDVRTWPELVAQYSPITPEVPA